MNTIVFPFKDLSSSSVAIAGGKGASLGEMVQAGFPVPPGVVLSADVFSTYLTEQGFVEEIHEQLKNVEKETPETIENASKQLRHLLTKTPLPKHLSQPILRAFHELGAEYVAVRSSATAEDSDTDSWAGELDTFLNTTEETLLTHIQMCWASLFTPRAIFYRIEREIGPIDVSVAVVIQRMVQPSVAGVAFSTHPVTQDSDQMVIEAGYGLGEALVSGQITPDTYVIHTPTQELVSIHIGEQEKQLVQGTTGKNEWQDIPSLEQSAQKLTTEHIRELSGIVYAVASHYGRPMDIEWAMEQDGTFYLTQARPITTLT